MLTRNVVSQNVDQGNCVGLGGTAFNIRTLNILEVMEKRLQFNSKGFKFGIVQFESS
jgi:hypothetical protein